MSRIPTKAFRHVRHEITSWREEGLIPDDLAVDLLGRYPEVSHQGLLVTLATIFGAILLGVGTLLFIAANWDQMGSWFKIGLILAGIIITNFFGWRFRYAPGHRPKVGNALFLLGGFIYGGGIWLISQIFNSNLEFATGMLLWSLGVAAAALASGLPSLTLMASILGGVWLISNSHEMPIAVAAVLAGLWLSVRARSPWSAVFCLVGGLIWMLNHSNTTVLGLIGYGAILFLSHFILRGHWQLMENPFKYIGLLSSMLGLLLGTFDHWWSLHEAIWETAAVGVTAFLTAGAVWKSSETSSRPIILGTALVVLMAWLMGFLPLQQMRVLASYALYVVSCAGLMAAGIRMRAPGLLNFGVVSFSIFIIVRYFDTFFAMLDRSIFFLAGGAVLLIAGAIVERSRRKLMEGWQS